MVGFRVFKAQGTEKKAEATAGCTGFSVTGAMQSE